MEIDAISTEELRDLDERLVLSKHDKVQWRTVSMAEYAKIRAYIRQLERAREEDLRGQLHLRRLQSEILINFFMHFFNTSDQIIEDLKVELSTIERELDRIHISEGYDLGTDHLHR